MASFTFIRLLFSLLLLLAIIDQIDSFYLHDSHSTNIPPQAIEHYDYSHQSRSVLWPKICMDLLKQRADQHLGEQVNRHHSNRFARKCYPFDIQ